jgi:hypothetical protein
MTQRNGAYEFNLQPETRNAIADLYEKAQGTVSAASMALGVRENEPLLVAFDAMIRYAKAHQKRFESPLGEDYVLGPEFGQVIAGLRALLNGDGAVAHEKDITTDSKDNGVLESLYWKACEIAGLDGNDL